MSYDAPGHADELGDELRERWNETIAAPTRRRAMR